MYKSVVIENVDYKVYDFTKSILKNSTTSESNVVIVDIDEISLRQLGQWPWPRVTMASLVDKINSYNPSSIGLDIIFPERDRTSPLEISSFYKKFFHIDTTIVGLDTKLQDNDLLFSQAIKNSNSVLSVYMSNIKGIHNQCGSMNGVDFNTENIYLQNFQYLLCNTAILNNSAKNFGFINMTKDSDGILRRMPLFREYKDMKIPTLALAMLLNIDSKLDSISNQKFSILGHEISTDEKSNILLNYYDDKWYKKISSIDVLSKQVSKEILTGKIVLIGSSAVALHDQVTIANGRNMAGVQIHSTIIDNILNDELLVQPQKYKIINLILSFLLVSLILFLLYKELNITTIILFIVVLVVSFYINILYIEEGIYISFGYFIFPFLVYFFLTTTLKIILEIFERKIFIEELNRSNIALLDSMVHVAEIHDFETGMHIVRTKNYVKFLAQYIYDKGIYRDKLTPSKIEIMYRTASLHDLGKVGIPDAILKKKGKLTDSEFKIMKTHSMLGMRIIDNAIGSYKENDFLIIGRNIAKYHHEKWDGSGYPKGLKGDNIPVEARLMALADVYDALISKRVYKEAFSYEETIKIITDGRGSHFDPIIVDAFLECIDEFQRIAELYSE